jgi:hypothetical protein
VLLWRENVLKRYEFDNSGMHICAKKN